MEFKKVSNPLTIIGIFAGIAHITITCAINFVSIENKTYLIAFAIGFPILLTLLFFFTLLTKPSVLYSPSDYKNERNFLKSLGLLESETKTRKTNRNRLKQK